MCATGAMPATRPPAAHELFAVLRELDADGVQLIWVEQPPDEPEWDGVRDRLRARRGVFVLMAKIPPCSGYRVES